MTDGGGALEFGISPNASVSLVLWSPSLSLASLSRRPAQVDGATRRGRLGGGEEHEACAWRPLADLLRDFLQVGAPFPQGPEPSLRKNMPVLMTSLSRLPSWCRKKQVVDLEEKGLWPELLDSGGVEIAVSDW